MQVGKFGSKVFEVGSNRILTFTDLSISGTLSTTSEEATQGKKPATKVKSPSALKVSMTLYLNAALGVNVQSEVESWMSIKDAGKAYPLIICGKAVSVNKFLLTSCKEKVIEVLRSGRNPVLGIVELSLDFLESPPPGVQPAAAAAAGTSSRNSAISINNEYSMPTAAEKSDLKRENAGMGAFMR